MAVICDMAKGRKADHRYFLEIVYNWIKTFYVKEGGYLLHINAIYCVLIDAAQLLTSFLHCVWCFICLQKGKHWRPFSGEARKTKICSQLVQYF